MRVESTWRENVHCTTLRDTLPNGARLTISKRRFHRVDESGDLQPWFSTLEIHEFRSGGGHAMSSTKTVH